MDSSPREVKWLVVAKNSLTQKLLEEELSKADANMNSESIVVPLDNNETAFEVTGPRDLETRLEALSEIVGVFPSSEMTYIE